MWVYNFIIVVLLGYAITLLGILAINSVKYCLYPEKLLIDIKPLTNLSEFKKGKIVNLVKNDIIPDHINNFIFRITFLLLGVVLLLIACCFSNIMLNLIKHL